MSASFKYLSYDHAADTGEIVSSRRDKEYYRFTIDLYLAYRFFQTVALTLSFYDCIAHCTIHMLDFSTFFAQLCAKYKTNGSTYLTRSFMRLTQVRATQVAAENLSRNPNILDSCRSQDLSLLCSTTYCMPHKH